MTHTIATLQVSAGAHAEITGLLRAAGYHHAFMEDGLVDMSGIGIAASPPVAAFERALDLRISQGFHLGGNACPILYTDTINDQQVCRDDLWIATTAGLKGATPPAVTPAAPSEVNLLEKAAVRVGMKSLMNHGAASCVYSEGCNGVSQAHLIAFAREVALHCVAAIATPPAVMPAAPSDAVIDTPFGQYPRDAWDAFEKHRIEQIKIPGMPGFNARPCFMAGWNAHVALSQTMQPQARPIDMVLHCPKCGLQHVDAPEDAECDGEAVQSLGWSNPPHKSHLCHGCSHIWRPADVPTNGVQAVKTTGKADSPISQAEPAAGEQAGAVADIVSKLDDLLDAYRDESLCKQYNGWWRIRDPQEVRREINALIDSLAAPGAAIAAREQGDAYSDPACQRTHALNRQWDSGFDAGYKTGAAPRDEAPATPQAALSALQIADCVTAVRPYSVALATVPAEDLIAFVRNIEAALTQPTTVQQAGPEYKSCRMEDGRCGICGGDWSVCGCDGMQRRAAAQIEPWMEKEAKYEAEMRETHAAMLPDITDDTPLETGEGDAR